MEILWGEAPIYPCAASTLSGPRRRGGRRLCLSLLITRQPQPGPDQPLPDRRTRTQPGLHQNVRLHVRDEGGHRSGKGV